MSGIYRVSLSDTETRLLWALSRGPVKPRQSGPTWDLDATETDPASLRWRWEDAVTSLRDWLAVYSPPVIVRHGLDEVSRSASGIPLAHGHVTGLIEVSADLAESVGAAQVGDALYMACDVSDELAGLLDDGLVPYFSPALFANYVDDEGVTWPLIVKELSLVLDPRQKRRQFPYAQTAALGAALLSEDASGAENDQTPDQEAAMAGEEGAEFGETIKVLVESVRALTERLDALEAAKMVDTAPDVDPVATEGAELSDDSDEVAALRKRVAELETAAKRIESKVAVEALLHDRQIEPAAAPHLIALHMADRKAAEAIIAAAPKRTGVLKRAPATGAPSMAALADMTREEMAAHLVQTGAAKSLTEAWNSLQQ